MNLSDHFATFLLKKKKRETRTKKECLYRLYNGVNVETVGDALIIPDSGTLTSDVNESWDKMEDSFIKVENKICPLRKLKVKKDRPSYFMNEISCEIKKRDELFKLARLENCKNTWKKTVSIRVKVRKQIKRAKKEFISNKLAENKSESKKYWRHYVVLSE